MFFLGLHNLFCDYIDIVMSLQVLYQKEKLTVQYISTNLFEALYTHILCAIMFSQFDGFIAEDAHYQ